MSIIEFIAWIAVIALVAAFVLSLLSKWKVIEWLQVHAPNDFLHELLSCRFCLSWWTCVIISLTLCVVTGYVALIASPICSTLLTREIWK